MFGAGRVAAIVVNPTCTLTASRNRRAQAAARRAAFSRSDAQCRLPRIMRYVICRTPTRSVARRGTHRSRWILLFLGGATVACSAGCESASQVANNPDSGGRADTAHGAADTGVSLDAGADAAVGWSDAPLGASGTSRCGAPEEDEPATSARVNPTSIEPPLTGPYGDPASDHRCGTGPYCNSPPCPSYQPNLDVERPVDWHLVVVGDEPLEGDVHFLRKYQRRGGNREPKRHQRRSRVPLLHCSTAREPSRERTECSADEDALRTAGGACLTNIRNSPASESELNRCAVEGTRYVTR